MFDRVDTAFSYKRELIVYPFPREKKVAFAIYILRFYFVEQFGDSYI